MNVSLNWLKDHLDLSHMSLQDIDDLLTFAGVEVEGISQKGVPSDKVVVAQVKSAEKHPDADKLKVCMVDAGEAELRQIVCGAQNYSVGDKVPCALPGADLGGGFVIKDGKLRGVESKGMLCGPDEIGLASADDGLMILSEDLEIGKPLQDLFETDTIIEVEVTPNRPDLLSHTGMARELAALAGIKRKSLDLAEPATLTDESLIKLSAPDSCPLYSAVKISGVPSVSRRHGSKQSLRLLACVRSTMSLISPITPCTSSVILCTRLMRPRLTGRSISAWLAMAKSLRRSMRLTIP